MADLPGDITDPEKIDPSKRVETHDPSKAPSQDEFASHMRGDNTAKQAGNVENQPSPMDVARQRPVVPSEPPTMDSVRNQMQTASGSLGDIKNQLHTKGLKLKQSQKYLLRNKLQSAHESIRAAAQKTGVDTGPPPSLSSSKNPIARFLSMVSDGQYQLNSAADQIKQLSSSGDQLNTGELLLVQAKMQKAQQELDYTSVILGKSIDMLKTVFNTQI